MVIQAAGASVQVDAGGGADVLTLSGQNVFAFSFGSPATADLKADNDGNMYQRLNFGVFTQIDSATDWVRPTSSSPGSYRFRFTNLTGDALNFSSAAEDVWRAVTVGDYIWTQTDATPTAGGNSSTFDVEIDEGGGTALETGSYTVQADREDF